MEFLSVVWSASFFQFGPLYATCVLLREMGQKPFGLFFSFSTLFFFPDQTKWTSKLAIFRGKPILNSILETSYAWTEDKGATLTRTLANTQCSASEPKTSPLKMSKSNDARSRVKTFFFQSIRVSTIQWKFENDIKPKIF